MRDLIKVKGVHPTSRAYWDTTGFLKRPRYSLWLAASERRADSRSCAKGGGPLIPPCSPKVGHTQRGKLGSGCSHAHNCGDWAANYAADEEEEADDSWASKLCGSPRWNNMRHYRKKTMNLEREKKTKSIRAVEQPLGGTLPWEGQYPWLYLLSLL